MYDFVFSYDLFVFLFFFNLGSIMMAVNVLAGVSALAATPLVGKFGAINTMVTNSILQVESFFLYLLYYFVSNLFFLFVFCLF
jgi:hypothetical protein